MLHALVLIALPLMQGATVQPLPRLPLPRPVAGAPMATINDNRAPAGRFENGTLTLALDIVEAAWRPEGQNDPVIPVLAFAERGRTPAVPGPLLRAPMGTSVRLTLRNRSDSAIMLSGFRPWRPADQDTVHVAGGATRELVFRLDSVGTFFYWGVLKGLSNWRERDWLDSQLTGAIVVDPAGTPFGNARDRVWVVTEWFLPYRDRPFESALVFNGKAWPHTERISLVQNDSVHWRLINAAAVLHPMHLHGFYFRVTHRGGERADTAIAADRQPLQNVQIMEMGGTMHLSFVPTTPGNWVFHCHFADHVSDHVSLAGSPEAFVAPGGNGIALATDSHAHDAEPGGHDMRGLVLGITVTPAPDYREPQITERRTLRLFAQKQPNRLPGRREAFGFMLQQGDSAPPRDVVQIPGPVLELRRGEPVRIVVTNNLDQPTGVHWHGLEIESFPDGVPGISGIGDRIMPPILPGESFAAEFTPPRSGTFPYHAHMHEILQIGSGMYGALIVTDMPRDTTRDHVIVAGGGGPAAFVKQTNNFVLVNGRVEPRPIHMTVGEANRIRLVSIHGEEILLFRLGTDSTIADWQAIAKDGADLPPALQVMGRARAALGPGETADFVFVPAQVGRMTLEVFGRSGVSRVELPIVVEPRSDGGGR
ncbi:MAG TPA: multicopper oxidase domain-containing protein [Gemmatimonadaceae bacterium]|nr:multicopper oxidase domain-containing protein [Gemmatimonadaceae bacterium]